MPNNVPVLDSFNHGREGWANYDVYDQTLRPTIRDQRHVNLRNFTNNSLEGWNTFGTAQLSPKLANGNIPSVTDVMSTFYDLYSRRTLDGLFGASQTFDIATDFDDDDHFVISFPNFPLATVNQAASYIEFTTDPTGSYDDPTQNLKLHLNQTLVPLVAGFSEWRVTLAMMKTAAGIHFDFTRVNSLHFFFQNTVTGTTIEINGVRMMDKNWKSGGIGMDTISGMLKRIPRRDGSAATDFAQPILWRSSDVPGTNDPRPIDANMVVPFSTGTAISANNRITLYFRELTEDFLTQLDLNGMTMAQLNGHDQPDIGIGQYDQRQVGDLERFTIGELQGESVFSLERTPQASHGSWIEFTLQFGAGLDKVTIQDTEGNGYNFVFNPLSTNSNYAFCTYLEENKVRAVLYKLDSTGLYQSTVFDTTSIDDDTAFKRRKGRFGWYANLSDGDTVVRSISPNGVTYGEYRSLPYASQTPVIGAELFVANSPANEFFESFVPQDATKLTIGTDTARTLSGSSYKIDFANTGPGVNARWASQPFTISDYDNAIIEFDVYIPDLTDYNDPALQMYVIGTNFSEVYQLVVPPIAGNQWEHVKINFAFNTPAILPGEVRIAWEPNLINGDRSYTIWMDNVSIKERSVVWDGRAVVDDPWNSNFAKWQPFRDVHSRDDGGIMFDRRGSNLQVRGRARKSDATINRVQYKPRYAELGKFANSSNDPSSYDLTNAIIRPNGETGAVTTVFAANGPGSHVTEGLIDPLDSQPALYLNRTSSSAATFWTKNTFVGPWPYVDGDSYYVAMQIRQASGTLATSYNLGCGLYQDFGGGTYASTPNSDTFVFSSPVNTLYRTLESVWTLTPYRRGFMVPGANYNVGLYFSADGLVDAADFYIRRITFVKLPRSSIRPSGPFDGSSTGARWLGPSPTSSAVTITPWSAPITPTFTSSNTGLAVTFTASAAKNVAIYEWNFGDGVRDVGQRVVHTYPASGSYPVTLTARDGYGAQAIYTNTIGV